MNHHDHSFKIKDVAATLVIMGIVIVIALFMVHEHQEQDHVLSPDPSVTRTEHKWVVTFTFTSREEFNRKCLAAWEEKVRMEGD